MVKPIRVSEVIQEPLPPLLNGFQTTSSALKRLKYRGELNDWANFSQSVRNTTDTQNWSSETIKYYLNSRNLEENEVFVGDESGVQGRFQQAIGQSTYYIPIQFNSGSLQVHFRFTSDSIYFKSPYIYILNPILYVL
ncbi:hypothetical protein ACN38_g787 [Penicillium nordicum]|uniref:Uncharacterized protein n=1 Tax=Penicillium nordicum TaxID=229535 RepID=A0A0M8PI77_9EURO|nr:hypothetical protein ACN38_g787 [Penicillium nordicum]